MDRGQVGHRRPTGTQWRDVWVFFLIFTYLAASSLSCGKQDLSLWPMGFLVVVHSNSCSV